MIAHKKLIVQGVVTSAWWRLRCVQCEVRVRVHALVRCSPCCLRSLFSPSQLASEPAETRSVGPATLTNWPLFTPHFPWCLCRTQSHAAYFFELSLPSPPMHQSPLSFPYLCFLCWSPAPTRVPQGAQLLSVSASVRLSVSTLFPPPTPPLSLSQSLFLSRCLHQLHCLTYHP